MIQVQTLLKVADNSGGKVVRCLKILKKGTKPRYGKIGDVIVFDDVTEKKFPGIVKAVNEISSEGNYEIKSYIENEERGYAIAKKII